MRFLLAQTTNTMRCFPRGLRLSALAGSIVLLAMIAPHAAFAQDGPHDGMFAIQAEGDEDPHMLLLEAEADGGTVMSTGPQIELYADGPGWVYSPFPLYVVTGSTRPWRMALSAAPMVIQDGGDEQVSLDDVEARDALAPTEWTRASGTPLWQNLTGNPEQYLALEFRVNVRHDHKPGHYVSQMTLDWVMPPADGLPASSGSIPMQLHLHVPEMLGVSLDGDSLTIPTIARDEGWAYSDGEITMTVQSIQDFDIHIASAPDLSLGDIKMPTALRLRHISGGGPDWDYWGDLGGSPHGQAEPPWSVAESTGSPWPGNVGAGGGSGETAIGISAAAWRDAYQNAPGDYTTSVVITISLP